MNRPRIEDWSVSEGWGLYDAPELRRFYIQGKVYGHHIFATGASIRTSDIVSVNGIRVITVSGSEYRLGRPNKKYVQWCREQGCHVPTPEVPIKPL